ncbi:hypothetical protein CW713_02590 [Methanophagales archaeon]|nr:MAG: hypothetical protein CW713_02590 [Methanophagales archaeon]
MSWLPEKNESSDFDEFVKNMEEEILEEAREIYTDKTLEEAYNPKNVGELETLQWCCQSNRPLRRHTADAD